MELPHPNCDHLCVLVHGLWGNPSHLDYVASAVRSRYSGAEIHLLACKNNAGMFTYDGIELGGERVTREIEDALEEYARNGVAIKKLSVVGYSLGGLVLRYAVGLLYSKGYFEKIKPVNFTTFATPHLGVRTPLLGWHNHIWNVLGARTLSASGRQLFTIDKFRDTNRPLLSVLADMDSVFYKGVSLFENKVLYANITNDRSTCYYTAGVSRCDPFADLSSITVNYLPGYSPIIVDPINPVSPCLQEDENLPYSHRIGKSTQGVAKGLPLIVIYMLVIPVGMFVFLVNAMIQTITSRRRIRLHGNDENLGIYQRLPLIVEEMQEAAENIIEDIHHEMSPQHLPAGSEESTGVSSPSSSPRGATDSSTVQQKPLRTISRTSSPSTVISQTDGASDAKETSESALKQQQRPMEFPTLALASHQFEMIKNLDALGFRKFPVFIHNDKHSHAAIIVRKRGTKKWEEGKVVVGHWLNEGFIV